MKAKSSTPPQKLLFICSYNQVRSLTAERLLARLPGIVARSAGTLRGARVPVTPEHVVWADCIFCMEDGHVAHLKARFPAELAGKRVVCLDITGYDEFDDQDLRNELRTKLANHVTLPPLPDD